MGSSHARPRLIVDNTQTHDGCAGDKMTALQVYGHGETASPGSSVLEVHCRPCQEVAMEDLDKIYAFLSSTHACPRLRPNIHRNQKAALETVSHLCSFTGAGRLRPWDPVFSKCMAGPARRREWKISKRSTHSCPGVGEKMLSGRKNPRDRLPTVVGRLSFSEAVYAYSIREPSPLVEGTISAGATF